MRERIGRGRDYPARSEANLHNSHVQPNTVAGHIRGLKCSQSLSVMVIGGNPRSVSDIQCPKASEYQAQPENTASSGIKPISFQELQRIRKSANFASRWLTLDTVSQCVYNNPITLVQNGLRYERCKEHSCKACLRSSKPSQKFAISLP